MNNSPKTLCETAIVSRGDVSRIQHALAKARRGEPIRVGVIGGSITEGASASTEAERWGNRVAQWWRETFPAAQVEFVNAGIGATGSDLGSHRVARHLLAQPVDFVVAEFAVNDGHCAQVTETLEGLTRQILSQPNQPGMMLLFLMNQQGYNVQDMHEPIGQHYGLPMVSYRDALWPEVKAGRVNWEDIAADNVHPNSRGHGYCADFVTAVLDDILAGLPPDSEIPPAPPLPAPLTSNIFEHTALFNRAALTPLRNEGWLAVDGGRFGPAWQSSTPGSEMEFTVEGTAISLLFYRIKSDMGMLEAQVDDQAPLTMDAWFDGDWGGYSVFQLLARDLPPGSHRLRVRLLNEKNANSNGHLFKIEGVLAAGL